MRGLRPRERQRRDQRIDATLDPLDPRPSRHLRPFELHHVPRPIARPLRRPLHPRPQPRQPAPNQIHRPPIAMLLPEQLSQPRRLDLRPLLQHLPDHPHQPIKLRPRRRPRYRGGPSDANALATVRRLIPNRLAIVRCDTPSLAKALISAHSNALTTSPGLLSSINPTSLNAGSVATEAAHFSIPRSGALLSAWRHISVVQSGTR